MMTNLISERNSSEWRFGFPCEMLRAGFGLAFPCLEILVARL